MFCPNRLRGESAKKKTCTGIIMMIGFALARANREAGGPSVRSPPRHEKIGFLSLTRVQCCVCC